jgi:predicted nucleic acid-binding protein
VDAFDADVLFYAAVPGHEFGRRVRALFPAEATAGTDVFAGIGSVLLLPELLTKPLREVPTTSSPNSAHCSADWTCVQRTMPQRTGTALGAAYGIRAPDAVHLATAVGAGADRFLTNNQKDFPRSIIEIDIVYPDDLPDFGCIS